MDFWRISNGVSFFNLQMPSFFFFLELKEPGDCQRWSDLQPDGVIGLIVLLKWRTS